MADTRQGAGGPKLAILAGGGTLPARIAEAVRGQGREVFVVAFDGHTDPQTVAGLPHLWSRFGAAGTILRRLHEEGVGDVVLAGPVKRPSFTELMPDWRTARFLARVGTRAEVLFERRGRHPGQIVGRVPWLQPVQVEGDAGLIGSIARVTITAAGPNSLFGDLADRAASAGAVA